MTKNYKIINNILGWLIGIFASAVYIMTAEPTASWWDCGEYISTGYKLLVGHPPGAPTFQLLTRIFTMFAGDDVTKIAFCANCLSAIASGLTIMFLFWTITMLGRKLVAKSGEMTTGKALAVFGSALVGGLCYTFTDTFWFSAVEGEVYALSSFFTALVFWCILKWDFEYDDPKSNVNPNRWIVLIAYLIGLSIGVHLLNLLTIPAIVLIVYFKLSKEASAYGVALSMTIISAVAALFCPPLAMFAIWLLITAPLAVLCFKKGTFSSRAEWGVFFSICVSFVLVGLILWGIVPMIVNLAGKFEIFFVNNFHLPFHSGTIIFFLLLAAIITAGLFFGFKRNKPILTATTFSFLFLLIGYSTFFILVIRSNANPTIDENNPEDAVSLLSYLNREQYGETPFLYGPTCNSVPYTYEDGDPVYVRDDRVGRYVVTETRLEAKYKDGEKRFMPRMYSPDPRHKQNYADWVYPNSPEKGNRIVNGAKKPTYEESITFMHRYQFYYMYLRYFMWNFSGRQNDMQGTGGELEGNWISGIPAIDRAFLGDQPEGIASMANKGTNKYFMLPLLLGLIGAIFYTMRDTKNSFIVFLLFIMTGLAIAFYLNMYAYQPRERDYAFAASFYAFAIWVGFGVYAIYSLFEKIKNNAVQIVAPILITLICIGLVPGIMASENWDDHDRSNRYTALATAKAYLDSCEPNAIIFTMGDNDTFCLWYAQEVEGYRTDVRVCNLSLLNASWYVDQMKRKAYDSDPLPISMTWDQYHDGSRNEVYLRQASATDPAVDIRTVMEMIKNPELDGQPRLTGDNRMASKYYAYIGQDITNKFSIKVDREKVLKTGTVKPENAKYIVNEINWISKDNRISRNFLIMMDILATNNWDRPIYFAKTTDEFFGMDDYLQDEGFAYRLVPMIRKKTADTEILYDHVMNVFDDHTRPDRFKNPEAAKNHKPYPYQWGGMNDPRVYNNEDNLRVCFTIQGMHNGLVKQLISEYKNSPDTMDAAKRIDKLQRAEAVLDHLQKVLPDNILPYKNNFYPYYTIRTIELADLYDEIREADTEHLLDDAKLAQKAKEVRTIIANHIKAELEFYEKASPKTLEVRKDDINLIYNQFLPALAEGDPSVLKGLPLSKNGKAMCDQAANNLRQMADQLDYMMDNYQAAIREIYSDDKMEQAQKEAKKAEFDENINTLYSNFRQELARFGQLSKAMTDCGDRALEQQVIQILSTYENRLAAINKKMGVN